MSHQPKAPVFGLFDGEDGAASSSLGASFGQPIPLNTRKTIPTARNQASVVVNSLPGDVFGSTKSENVFSASNAVNPATGAALPHSTHVNGNPMASKTPSVPLAQNLFAASPGPNADPFFDRLLPSVQTPTKFPDTNASVPSRNGVQFAVSSTVEVKTPVRRPPTITSAVSTPNPVTPVVSMPKVAPQKPTTAYGSVPTLPGAAQVAVQTAASTANAPGTSNSPYLSHLSQ